MSLWLFLRDFRGEVAAPVRAGEVEHPAGVESCGRLRASLVLPSLLVRPRFRHSFAQFRPGRRSRCAAVDKIPWAEHIEEFRLYTWRPSRFSGICRTKRGCEVASRARIHSPCVPWPISSPAILRTTLPPRANATCKTWAWREFAQS